jgi:hypothetical protein
LPTSLGVTDEDIARTRLKPRPDLELAPLDVKDDAAVAEFARRHDRVDAPWKDYSPKTEIAGWRRSVDPGRLCGISL